MGAQPHEVVRKKTVQVAPRHSKQIQRKNPLPRVAEIRNISAVCADYNSSGFETAEGFKACNLRLRRHINFIFNDELILHFKERPGQDTDAENI